MLMSGHTTDGSTEIRLFPIDEIHTELCLILWAAATAVFIYIGRYVGIRLFSLFALLAAGKLKRIPLSTIASQ